MTEDTQQMPAESSTTPRRKKTSSPASDARRTVNFVLQGKGGIGKTMIASLIAQALMDRNEPVVCIDTDPVNASFSGISSLGAVPVQLMLGDVLNVAEMNAVSERAMVEDAHFVFDNGAASFLPMTNYLVSAEIFSLIVDGGKRAIVHIPVIGGKDFIHTVSVLAGAARTMPACVEIVPWFNGYFGALVSGDGTPLEETELYGKLSERLTSPVRMPDLHPTFAGAFFKRMLDEDRTFADERDDPSNGLIQKMWAARTWALINEQLNAVM